MLYSQVLILFIISHDSPSPLPPPSPNSNRGVCTKPPCYCVVMEFCSGGTLYEYIQRESEILPPQVVGWSRQMASGMLYLHSKKIIHRDLKSLK